MASVPSGLDIAASRSAGRVYLHVANPEFRRAVEAVFSVRGMTITDGRVLDIAPEDLRQYAGLDRPKIFRPRETPLAAGPAPRRCFPAGSVAAVELDLQPAA